jgi:hypothetical protein
MKYIKISNTAIGGVNRLRLEKLGLSTKRNDPDTIGQFGSGIKYAPISAIRMGLDFVFVGSDDKGEYQLRYKVVDEEGINSIVYDYGDYQKPSSFTVDAGSLSWDSEWQIYREIVSNAMDEGDWTREIVDNIENDKNSFAIYISASPKMIDVYNDHDKYFCTNREVFYYCDRTDVKFLQKHDSSERLYNKGVLCHTEEIQFPSLFDYNFLNGDLNEDRSFKYVSTERLKIAKAIAWTKNKELIKEILEEAFETDIWEFNFISDLHWNYVTPSSSWKLQFHKMYGENAVIVSPEQSLIQGLSSLIKAKGMKAKYCTSNAMFSFLKECEIATCEDLIDEKYEYITDDDLTKYPKLIEAIKIASHFEPGLLNMPKPVIVFDTQDDEVMLGLTVNVSKEIQQRQIMIAKHHAEGSSVRELVGTIIHEYDHYSSGLGDSMYREFRSLADSRISKLMLSMYKETPAYIHNGIIKIKLKDLPMFSSVDFIIQPVEKTSWHLARIGKLTFKLNIGDEKISLSGVAMPDKTGEELEINIGHNGTISRLD